MNSYNRKSFLFFLCLFLVCTMAPTLADGVPAEIRLQNEQEKRLWEDRDTDEILAIKLKNLEVVNRDRALFGAPPVKMDILAGRVANRHCRDMALNGFMSHWNMKGEKPYHRYAFAGGTDHVSENLASVTSTGRLSDKPESLLDRMNESEKQFMAEPPGQDGHKKNVIRKSHTHVGIGVYVHEGEFRYAQEFVDRYTTFDSVSAVVPGNGKVALSGAVIPPDTGIYAVLVYREKLTPMTVEQLNNTHSYPDYSDDKQFEIWPWDLSFDRKTKTFNASLDFKNKAPGYYYVHMYFKKPVSSIPYDQPASADTMQAACATGIVLIHNAPVPAEVAAQTAAPSHEAGTAPASAAPNANPAGQPNAGDQASPSGQPEAGVSPSPAASAQGATSFPTPVSSETAMSGTPFPAPSQTVEAGPIQGGPPNRPGPGPMAFLSGNTLLVIIGACAVVIPALILIAVRLFRPGRPAARDDEDGQSFDF